MKKTMAYTATAILLGVVIMMLPLTLGTAPTNRPLIQPGFTNTLTKEGEQKSMLLAFQTAGQLSNLLPSSLVFFSGLIVALGVYTMLKRRMI